jgi:hypothetical protein
VSIHVVGYRVGQLDPAVQGYPLELFDPVTGTRIVPVDPDRVFLPKAEVDAAVWNPAGIRAAFANTTTFEADLRAAGSQMHQWLDRGVVGQQWTARRAAGELVLLDVVATDLADLPWELMVNLQGDLVFGLGVGVARFHAGVVTPNEDPPSAGWPLRVWIVNAAPNDPAVQAKEEIDAIRSGTFRFRHTIDLKIDAPDTLIDAGAFQAALKSFRPHILHFIGHSGLAASRLPALFVQAAVPWNLTAAVLRTALTNSRVAPRLAFLNACRTAGHNTPHDLPGAFIRAGVPAVISMQGPIRGDIAGRLAAAVYKELAAAQADLSTIVTGARVTMANAHEWAYPVLSLSGSPEGLLPPLPPTLQDRFQANARSPVFAGVQMFSGRSEERRSLRSAICPYSPTEAARHFVLIAGEREHGKSHVAKRCLECFDLRGYATQYVAVADTQRKSLLDVLLIMLKPSATSLPGMVDAYRRFKWEATQILNRGAATPWDGVTDVPEPGSLTPEELKNENAMSLLAGSARAALAAAATLQTPVFIVFDEFRDGSERALSRELFGDFLWPLLFDHVEQRHLPNVYMALVLWREDAEFYELKRWVSVDQWLTIPDLPAAEFADLVMELFGYGAPELMNISVQLKTFAGTQSTAGLLRTLEQLADNLYKDGSHRRHVGRSR